jgi:hypothetical protein
VGQRVRRDVREVRRQRQAELLHRQRTCLEGGGHGGAELPAVEVQRRADRLADLALPLLDRAGEGAQHQGVVGGEQVDRAAHRHQPDQRPVLEPGRDVVRVEALDPRREGEVRRQVLLGLEPDEVTDCGRHVVHDPLQQVLAGQQGAVEVAGGELHPSNLESAGRLTPR